MHRIGREKVLWDTGGKVCWIFEPELTRRYLGRSDLQIR